MLRHACLGLFFAWACLVAAPTVAQAQEAARWALSGGFDLIEMRKDRDGDAVLLDGTFSLGNGTDQLMLVTQGGGALANPIDKVQGRLFYGRTMGNATLLVGIRQDVSPHSDSYAAIGVQGNVGTRLGWEAYVFVSKEGRLTGEAQIIYQLPITSRLYLEPRVGLGWSAQAVAADAVRSGFTAGEGTLRLRYRLRKKLNIYTALVHERLLGGTRRLVRDQGDVLQSSVAAIGFGFSL